MSGISLERLREVFAYDAERGQLVWVIPPKRTRVQAGDIAGSVYKNGYRYIEVDGFRYRAHRVVWFYMYGTWPTDYLDHVNGVKDDNRIENLRECDNSLNQANRGPPSNNTSGLKGVSWDAPADGWRASITIRGEAICIGIFGAVEEAGAAYAERAAAAFGDFARTE